MVMHTLPQTAMRLRNTPTIHHLHGLWGRAGGVHVRGHNEGHPPGDRRPPPSTAATRCAPTSAWCCPCSSPSTSAWACWRSCGSWNDYLLPYLVLDKTSHRTIPIHPVPPERWPRGPGRRHSPDHALHHPGHPLLPVLPAVHHQRRGSRGGEGVNPEHPATASRPTTQIVLPPDGYILRAATLFQGRNSERRATIGFFNHFGQGVVHSFTRSTHE